MAADRRFDHEELLADGLVRIGYDPDSDRLRRLVRYVSEIELWNPRLKLVAASGRELVVRHILDSLAGAAVIFGVDVGAGTPQRGEPSGAIRGARPRRIADIGSGAGLPGIPIAIMHPECRVDLVERSGRRTGFLRNAVAAVRASNATVHELDAGAYRGPADALVFRAFLPLSAELLAVLRGGLATGGVIYAYKGRRAAIDAELGSLDAEAVRIVPISVPFLNEERHLVVFEPTTRA